MSSIQATKRDIAPVRYNYPQDLQNNFDNTLQ